MGAVLLYEWSVAESVLPVFLNPWDASSVRGVGTFADVGRGFEIPTNPSCGVTRRDPCREIGS